MTPPMWKWAVGETSTGPVARSAPIEPRPRRPSRRSGARPPLRRDERRRAGPRPPVSRVPRGSRRRKPVRRRRGSSARAERGRARSMKRSPSALVRRAPAPRKPSSSTAPVSADVPATSPVGWNWSISMSRNSSPARQHIAIPSPVFSRAGAAIRYIVADPPVATTTTRARSTAATPVRVSSTVRPDRSPC